MLWLLEPIENISFSDLVPLLSLLSRARRRRIQSITNEAARVRSILAELLLRYALRAEYSLTELPEIETGKKGKPFFPAHPDLHFNLSHCKTAVACALDAAPVGVDVEDFSRLCRQAHRSPVPSIYRVLSETERAWVEEGETLVERDRRFAAVWTCKEAYGKALGHGILYDLRSTAFLPGSDAWSQNGFTFQQLELDGAFLTLCAGSVLPIQRLSPSRLGSFETEDVT